MTDTPITFTRWVDKEGQPTQWFYLFIKSLWNKTGGSGDLTFDFESSEATEVAELMHQIDAVKQDEGDGFRYIPGVLDALPTSLTVSVTGNYTTTGFVDTEILICSNSVPINITLNSDNDGQQVIIKRQNAEVKLLGNGNTVDGESSMILGVKYDAPHLIYTTSAGEYSIT